MQKKLIVAGFSVSFAAILANLAWDAFSRNSPAWYNVIIGLIYTAFSLLHGIRYFGRFRTGVLFVAAAVISFIMEYAGVTTGLPFGHYRYGGGLGPKILDAVPALIPCAWFMFMYGAVIVTNEALARTDSLRKFLNGRGGAARIITFAAFDSIVMTALDILIDPIAVHKGVWTWTAAAQMPPGRLFYGIPASNYFGWLSTTFVIFLIFRTVFFLRGDPFGDKDLPYFLPAVNYAAIFAVATIQAWTLLGNTGLIFVSISTAGVFSLMGLYRLCEFWRDGSAGE